MEIGRGIAAVVQVYSCRTTDAKDEIVPFGKLAMILKIWGELDRLGEQWSAGAKH